MYSDNEIPVMNGNPTNPMYSNIELYYQYVDWESLRIVQVFQQKKSSGGISAWTLNGYIEVNLALNQCFLTINTQLYRIYAYL